MANLQDVVQKIVILGGGEAGEQFAHIGREGAEAFKTIAESATGAEASLGSFAAASRNVVTAVIALVAAVATASVKAAEMAHETSLMGEALGSNLGGMNALRDAWTAAGGDAEVLIRVLERMAIRYAQTQAAAEKAARESPLHEEAATQRVIAAKLHVDEVNVKQATSSEEWRNKLTKDATAVGEAYVNLQFAAQESSSKIANSLLAVEQASSGVKNAILGVASAALGVRAAELSARQARGEDVRDEQKQLRIDQADQQIKEAKQREQDAKLRVEEADQKEKDAKMGAAKTQAESPFAMMKAMQAVADATLKERKDTGESMLVLSKNSLEAAEALLKVKEAVNARIDAEHANIERVQQALKSGDTNFLRQVTPRLTAEAIQLNSRQRSDFDEAKPVIAEFLELLKSVKNGLDTSTAAGVAQAIGAGRGPQVFEFIAQAKSGRVDEDKIKAAMAAGEQDEKAKATAEKSIEIVASWRNSMEIARIAFMNVGSQVDFTSKALDAFKETLKSLGLVAGGGHAPGKAGGGHIVGPGTGTSDTAGLFALSDGEYVVRASAVSRVGLAFMDALNAGMAPGFALGGFVGGAGIRRMGDGGSVRSGSTLNLTIGNEKFEGLHAPENVAGKLKSYAIGRQTAQTGPKPSWFK